MRRGTTITFMCCCCWKCKVAQPPQKTVWHVLKNLKLHPPYDPIIALLSICPRDIKAYIYTKTCAGMVIAALCVIAKT